MDNKYNKPNILINNVVSFILNSNINNDKTREVIDKLLNNLTFTKKYIIRKTLAFFFPNINTVLTREKKVSCFRKKSHTKRYPFLPLTPYP